MVKARFGFELLFKTNKTKKFGQISTRVHRWLAIRVDVKIETVISICQFLFTKLDLSSLSC